ncbi:uncharacterized protein LOC115240793 [Formica exsecta]|uniref:uncharacterized protein LOC115240793 n=1 Tax=Formica exsecta TaxID=72781 RepID=UPI0011426F45|nr:uncharacterized protein LOC115240793 [Formica exsecta]
MNFQSVNPLNIRLNLFSGNLLPMTSYDSSFPLLWKIYSVFVWMIELIIGAVLIPGCMYVSTEKVLKDGMICFAVFIEMAFMIARIHIHKDVANQLIRRLNDILRTPPLNFYWSAGVASIIAWTCIPLVLVFEKNLFYYEDYRIPAAFSRQPFSLEVFLLGSLFLMISAVYMFLKKVGVDVYMVHLVLMTTAQYRYIAVKIAMIFQENDENNKEHSSKSNQRKEKEIIMLCRHHNTVIHITSLLKKLLSLNFSLIYMNSVFRFCFIGIMLSMSTEMTDKAFHEDWHLLKPSIKRMFILIIMANNLECKLATFENFNLSLPSFMVILNQSYSISLLFLKMK